MEKLIRFSSVAIPLPVDNCDTDQIMPKQFLRGIDKKGLARGCFFNMRFFPDGTPRPDSVFNRPGFERAGIIVAGPNYGCGSSREHAVWGELQLGIRAVIAPGFGEIFYSNCFNNGLLAAKVSREASEEIFRSISDRIPTELTVDLAQRKIFGAGKSWDFEIGERHRAMLMEGLDMVGATLRDLAEIQAFRDRHEKRFPWMARLPAEAKARLAGD